METRRRNRRVQVASSDQASSLGVHAPSVVQTQSKAAGQAFALSNALGFAQEFAGEQIKLKQGRDEEAGSLAAMNGEFTDEQLHTMEKSAAYVRGAQKVLAKQRIVEDAAAAQEWYQTEFDKGAGLDELRSGLNDFWKSRYDGISTGLAREVAPLMAQTSEKLMTAHAINQAEQVNSDIQTAITTSAAAAFENGSMDATEWSVAREDAIALVGKDRANELLFAAVEQSVAKSGNPDVWDEPYLEMIKTNPKYAQRAAKSQDDARKSQKTAFDKATIVQRARIEADLNVRAEAGDPAVLTDLSNQLAAGMVDEGIVRTVTKKYADAVVAGTEQAAGTDAFHNATTSYLDLNNEDYNAVSKAALSELVAEHGEEEGYAMFLDGVAKNGRMPQFLDRMMKNASPANPEGFDQAYQVFSTIRQADPAGSHKLFTDETQTLFESYEVLVNDYGDPQIAVQKLNEIDPSLVGKVDRGDYNDALSDAIGKVEDGPFFNNLDEADPYTRKLVTKRMNHMIAMGYAPEKAAEFAVNDIKSRYAIADGKLWPNTAGFQSDPTSVLEYTRERYSKLDAEGREVEVVPNMARPGYAWVRPKGSLPFAGEPVKVSDLDAHYRTDQKRIRDEALMATQAETKADLMLRAKQRATGLYSLSLDKSVMGDRLRQAQDDAWYKLSPAARQKVIDDIEAEDQARRDDRIRRASNPDIMLAP